ncbi:MAG: winged helix-turn-helix domain-containing protein, partial [Pseudomonadota bacterium]|nr:winged helix-turn-helix domain-containing protein [Pseudomonadota bacterium]
MRDGPDIARAAALIGDPARAAMLCALMDGRALTASELAAEAGIGRPAASAHLARLREGGILAEAKQGRARYFRLASAEAAAALEALMGLAAR